MTKRERQYTLLIPFKKMYKKIIRGIKKDEPLDVEFISLQLLPHRLQEVVSIIQKNKK